MAKENPLSFLKLPFKLPFMRNESKPPFPPPKTTPRLMFVCFIVDWNKAQDITHICDQEKVRYHFICKGRGTARSDVLDILGIGAGDKAVIFCIEQRILIPVLLREVRKKLGFHTPGAGIAFTIPLSAINTPLLRVFKESIHKNEKISGGKGVPMSAERDDMSQSEIKNDLIIGVINPGYSEDFMNAAREAGASGGTVLNTRGLTHEGPVKFFGVSVQEEKETVLIVASREKKVPIMEAVSRSCGIASRAEGLIFSLPVDSVMGLNLE